jgi:hypothetical protein
VWWSRNKPPQHFPDDGQCESPGSSNQAIPRHPEHRTMDSAKRISIPPSLRGRGHFCGHVSAPTLESSTSAIFKGIRHVGYVCSFAFFSFQCSPDEAIVVQVRVHTVRANIPDAPGHPPTNACLVSTDANFRLYPNIKRCTRNNFLGRAGGVLHSSEPWICASTCIHLHMAAIIWIAGSLNKREFFWPAFSSDDALRVG